jgi:thiamine-monophosphate kinase
VRCLSDYDEFALIARIERAFRDQRSPQIVLGIGDDAALVRPRRGEDLVVTTDALVEGVHFRWETQAPVTIGRRALNVNLSDLAAMGARPLGFTLALAAPPSLPIRRFGETVRGLALAARRYGCPLVGGNVSRARELSLSVTAFGAVKAGRALTRRGARPGDRLFVTGTLGGAALALARAEAGRGRIRRAPEPRLRAGQALARMRKCGPCIDLSDGLVADLEHLLEGGPSGRRLGAELNARGLPYATGLRAQAARLGLDAEALATAGGEDYELLFALRASCASAKVLTRRLQVAVTEIGTVVSRPGISGLSRIARAGWRHF